MSEKILLIDGHSILNRAFYGLPDLTNGEGDSHRGCIWFPEHPFSYSGRGKTGLSYCGF